VQITLQQSINGNRKEKTEMKKTIFLISLIVVMITLTAYKTTAQSSSATPPATIQDPLLREGWSLLNQKTDPVQLWDGRTVSGHELAQFVLDHNVPIIWDVNNTCAGGSCSLRCYSGDGCALSDSQTSARPIFLSRSLMAENANQLVFLVDAMAHEIFHYTLPYGAVDDTLYEEFSAYYVGEHVTRNLQVNFDDYNPLRPACLVKWFYDTQTLQTYQHLQAYPQSVLPSVDTSSSTCLQPGASTLGTGQDSPLTASLNPDGSVKYELPARPTPTPEYRVECKQYPGGLTGCETIWLTQPPAAQATPGVTKK
jgi:hypothetical protein